jgi:hypothetical protein
LWSSLGSKGLKEGAPPSGVVISEPLMTETQTVSETLVYLKYLTGLPTEGNVTEFCRLRGFKTHTGWCKSKLTLIYETVFRIRNPATGLCFCVVGPPTRHETSHRSLCHGLDVFVTGHRIDPCPRLPRDLCIAPRPGKNRPVRRVRCGTEVSLPPVTLFS